jgi:hypothetical protein
MQRDRGWGAGEQEREQTRQVWEVSSDQDVTGLASQTIANPGRRIVRLQIGRRLEFGERVAGAPERLGGLAGAKLAAVPDDLWPRASRGRLVSRACGLRFSKRRQRPARVDFWADRITVVNEKQLQCPT